MDPRNLGSARAFLSQPRFAFVGLSRDEKDFSRYVFRELLKRGIDVVPVNPGVAELEGRRCFRSVAAGVKRVWFRQRLA
jgi:predicted CoA-binding protein